MYYVTEADGEIFTAEKCEYFGMLDYCKEAETLLDAINIALNMKQNERFAEIHEDYYKSELDKLKKEIRLLKERL